MAGSGDAPIKTIGISLTVPASRAHHFTDLAYKHSPFIDQPASRLPHPSRSIFQLTAASGNSSSNGTGWDLLSGSGMVTKKTTETLKAAAFTTVHGKKHITSLLRMLKSYDEHFHRQLGFKYPFVLFCEDVPAATKRRLR